MKLSNRVWQFCLPFFLVVSKQFLLTFFPVSHKNENEQQTRVHWLRLKFVFCSKQNGFCLHFPRFKWKLKWTEHPNVKAKNQWWWTTCQNIVESSHKNIKNKLIILSYLLAIFWYLKKIGDSPQHLLTYEHKLLLIAVLWVRIRDPGSGAFLTPGSRIRDPE